MKGKRLLIGALAFLLAATPFATAAIITGFSQLEYYKNFSVNVSTLSLMTGNTTRFFISDTGMIGIGTVQPSYALQIAAGVAGKTLNVSDALYVNGSSGSVGIGVRNGTAYLDIRGATGSTASVRILTGTPPSSPLVGDIYSDGTDLFFYDGTTWQDLTRETGSAGGWTDSGDFVALTTAADFVGIGTSSPTEKLQVSGNTSVSEDIYVGGNVIALGGSGASDFSAGWADDGTLVRLASISDRVGIGTANTLFKLEVLGNVSLNKTLYVLTSGRVGIGTDAPAATLGVQGSGNYSGTVEAAQFVGDGSLLTGISADSIPLGISGNFSNLNVSKSFLANDVLYVNGSRVGIGTASPTQAVTLGSNGQLAFQAEAAEKIYLTNNAAPNVGKRLTIAADSGDVFRFQTRAGYFRFTKSTSDTDATPVDLVRITNDGKFAISNTIPNATLHVSGTGNFSGTLEAAQFVGDGSLLTGVSTSSVSAGAKGNFSELNVSKRFIANDVLYVNGSRVGIGTDNPTQPLHVSGDDGQAWEQIARFDSPTTNSRLNIHGDSFFDGTDITGVQGYPNGLAFDGTGVSNSAQLVLATSGNVGMGTSNPTTKLHVNGTIQIGDAIGATLRFYRIHNTPNGELTINDTLSGERMRIDSNGNVGIGTDPNYPLQVSGTSAASQFAFSNTADAGTAICRGGVDGNGFYQITFCTSLAKYKENVSDLSLGLDTLMKLRPVQFEWDEEHGDYEDLGFIAEDVEKIAPLLAEYREDALQGVKYRQMTALLTKAIQEQQSQIEKQQTQIGELESEIASLKMNQKESLI